MTDDAAITARIHHAYPVEYVPRTGRNTRKAWVCTSLPVLVPAMTSATVAVEMERVVKPYPMFSDKPETRTEAFSLIGGRLSRRVEGADGRAAGIEALAGVDPSAPGHPWTQRGYPYQDRRMEGRVAGSLEELLPRQLKIDGREAAEARVAELARRTAVVDGVLHAPGPEPVWGVRYPHDCGVVQVAACLEDQAEDGTTFAMFRADRLDRAVAVAQALAGDASALKPDKAFRVEVVGAITVHRPDALRYDEVATYGMRRVLNLVRHPVSSGFASLPVPVLREWLSFREAADRLAGGDPGALMQALSALARCKEALPEAPDPQSRSGHHEAIGLLHRLLGGLPAMVAHWEADLGAAISDADAEALAEVRP